MRWTCWVLGALTLAACEAEGSHDGSPSGDQAAAFVSAGDLEAWPEVRVCRHSIEHDLSYIRVLASPEAKTAYLERKEPFPEGAILVKPEYADEQCKSLVRLTAMRRPTTAPTWEWQELSPSLDVLQSGTLAACASCHASCDGGHDGVCAHP